MKIIALHTDFRIYWPARLKALSESLKKRGDSFEVIEIAGKGSHYSFAGESFTDGLKWHILFPESKPEELSGKIIEPPLFNLLESINPDVIIVGAIAFFSGALAVRWGQKTGCKVVAFDTSKIEVVRRNLVVNFVKRSVYNGVDAMFYPASDWILTGDFWGFHKDQMFYGVDAVDNDYWELPKPLEYNWGNYFVAVGRQIPQKNFYTVVRAYKKYIDCMGSGNAYNLVLIGDGPEHEQIADFVNNEKLSDKVIFMPFLSQDELRGIYQHAKALILGSRSETWGLVINEAMAGGCPVFASYECGASNVLVHDGINGFRFHCDDVDRQASIMIHYHNLSVNKQVEMRKASKKIIADWGLSRFAQGALDAIDYVAYRPKRKTSLLDKQIIKFWKGQYRPI